MVGYVHDDERVPLRENREGVGSQVCSPRPPQSDERVLQGYAQSAAVLRL